VLNLTYNLFLFEIFECKMNVCFCFVTVTGLDQMVTESDDQRFSGLHATVAQVTTTQYIYFETKVSLVAFISYFRERMQFHGS
jgi:hypothetical protein